MPRVLVSDKLSPTAVQIFKDRGVEVDYLPDVGPDKEKMLEIIGQYDGLAIRSATKVTEKLIAAATNLKVIGRAGIGVDNVDIPAASRKGIIVMNTPFGNSITTAEHAVAMMFALARQLPEANASTKAGKWEKNRFMGVEITGKTLGVIGCGNIGSIVCSRAIGLKMHVVAFDPFLSPERAELLGGVTNAINMPSLSAEEAPRLKPYMALAEKLGSLVGQLSHGSIAGLSIETEGAAAELNMKPITGAVLAGFMRVHSDTVNMVNAPFLAKERGLDVREVRHDREGDYHTLLRVSAETKAGPRTVSGTLFGNSAPRLVELFGIKVEADLVGNMLYVVNEDAPGFIGRLGTTLGEAGINIGTFHLGRVKAGGEAVLLLSVDEPVGADVIAKVEKLPGVKLVRALKF